MENYEHETNENFVKVTVIVNHEVTCRGEKDSRVMLRSEMKLADSKTKSIECFATLRFLLASLTTDNSIASKF